MIIDWMCKILHIKREYKYYWDAYKWDNKILNEVSKDFWFYDTEYDLNNNLE